MEQDILVQVFMQYAAPYVAVVITYVATMLTISMAAHSFATLVLRPIVALTPNKEDDKWVELLVWWTDAVADVLREWALGKWVKGWQRARRMWEDRNRPLRNDGTLGAPLIRRWE